MEYVIMKDRIEYRDENGKVLALQTYTETAEGVMDIDHTEVDSSLQGQGIAGKLTELSVVYLKNQGKKILTSCSYVALWFVDKPQYHELLAE